MTKFIQDIQTRFGDGAALLCALWINFYLYRDDRDDYITLVKKQIAIVINHTGVNAKLFNKLVLEVNAFLHKHEHTVH